MNVVPKIIVFKWLAIFGIRLSRFGPIAALAGLPRQRRRWHRWRWWRRWTGQFLFVCFFSFILCSLLATISSRKRDRKKKAILEINKRMNEIKKCFSPLTGAYFRIWSSGTNRIWRQNKQSRRVCLPQSSTNESEQIPEMFTEWFDIKSRVLIDPNWSNLAPGSIPFFFPYIDQLKWLPNVRCFQQSNWNQPTRHVRNRNKKINRSTSILFHLMRMKFSSLLTFIPIYPPPPPPIPPPPPLAKKGRDF